MPRKKLRNPVDYIVPLNINGLEGRMMHVPSPSKTKNREILLVYGHHAMIERWWGLVENLHDYGAVTVPDLPGFGGMDSFYTINRRPDIDVFADYLAAFIKLRYKRKNITIVGISFGFLIVTRMLQKYPELAKRVDLLVSVIGFMHKDDFVYSPRQRRTFAKITRLFATRPVSLFIRYVGLNKPFLKFLYAKLPQSKLKLLEVTEEEFIASVDFETKLWQANDVRTHFLTTSEFLEVDNCQVKIDLPVHHVISQKDQYFNNEVVEQHMLIVFKKYHKYIAASKAHTPSVLGDKKEMAVLLPPALRKVLSKK
jgi:pimeloyl-ACP methyl ester carboxylesterase